MKLKLDINEQSIHKFGILIGNQLGKSVDKVLIEGDTISYDFRFRIDGDNWHFELERFDKNSGMFTLKCSTRMLEVPLNHIKDLKTFCSYIAVIRQMQLDYLNNK